MIHNESDLSAWRPGGLSKSVISRVIIGATPLGVLIALLTTYLLSPLRLQVLRCLEVGVSGRKGRRTSCLGADVGIAEDRTTSAQAVRRSLSTNGHLPKTVARGFYDAAWQLRNY